MSQGRVAYVCADPGIPPDSSKGASVHFRTMAAAMARIGVDLDVFMTRDGDVSGFAPHRARVVPTPRQRGIAGEVLQLGHSSTLLQAMAAAGPHRAVYERLSLFAGAGLAHARALGVPFVVEVNAPLWLEAAAFRSLHLGATAQALCIDVLRNADAVLSVSKELAELLVQSGAPRERVHVLGNGADLHAFQSASPQPRPPQLQGKPVLLFAGSLKPWHGVEFLLEAFAALRKSRPCGLWVIGDGPAKDAVLAAQTKHPHDIVYQGPIEHEEMPAFLASADAICAPYPKAAPLYFSPLKIVEGLAARRPLLASKVPCVLGELPGRNAHLPGLFEPDDISSFVAAAERVLADPKGSLAEESLVQALDWTEKARHVQPHLSRLIAEAPRG